MGNLKDTLAKRVFLLVLCELIIELQGTKLSMNGFRTVRFKSRKLKGSDKIRVDCWSFLKVRRTNKIVRGHLDLIKSNVYCKHLSGNKVLLDERHLLIQVRKHKIRV